MSTPKPTHARAAEPGPGSRVRLHYLDGIRGLAALFVVFHHVWRQSLHAAAAETSPLWRALAAVLSAGHFGVAVFIVLSGFCLMLPVARSADGRIPGGIAAYLKRRSRRILPPYYAALAFSLAAMAVIPGLRVDTGTVESLYRPGLMPAAIASHLLMIHNLNADWIFRINGPMWSVATEYQIYFLFPLLLLPLWRRFGLAAPVIAGFVIGEVTIRLGLDSACFWYVALFAVGMAAAVAACSPAMTRTLSHSTWMLLALLYVCAGCSGGSFDAFLDEMTTTAVRDLLVGLGTGCLLVGCAASIDPCDGVCRSPVTRLLSLPLLVGLGQFSYSLYLVHFPIVLGVQSYLTPLGLTRPEDFVLLSALSVSLSLGFSFVFHVAFERPFMNGVGRRTSPARTVITPQLRPA